MIYVECKPDQSLAQVSAKLCTRDITHELQGKFAVLRRLSAGHDLAGMVDEDPTSIRPSTLDRMAAVEEIDDLGIALLHDPAKNNHLVLLRPRLEEWVIAAAKEGKKNLSRYGLSERAKQLHDEINIDIRKFERLLGDLRDTRHMLTLGRVLREASRRH